MSCLHLSSFFSAEGAGQTAYIVYYYRKSKNIFSTLWRTIQLRRAQLLFEVIAVCECLLWLSQQSEWLVYSISENAQCETMRSLRNTHHLSELGVWKKRIVLSGSALGKCNLPETPAAVSDLLLLASAADWGNTIWTLTTTSNLFVWNSYCFWEARWSNKLFLCACIAF